jgi:hypothetical protein
MELEYIKSKNGKMFFPQKAGEKDLSKNISNYPVCIIKPLSNGRFQIDYFDSMNCKEGYSFGDEDKPNTRVILYPGGIDEVSYYIPRSE